MASDAKSKARARRRTTLWIITALFIALSIPIHVPSHHSQQPASSTSETQHASNIISGTPPIVYIFRFLYHFRHLLVIPLSYLYKLVLVVIATSLYILRPLIVATNLLLSIFVFTPYRITVYIIETLYPVYVFCGAACIIGALMGLCASSVYKSLFQTVFGVDHTPDLRNNKKRERVRIKE